MRILDHLANRYNTDTLKNHFNNAIPTSMIVVDDFFPEDRSRKTLRIFYYVSNQDPRLDDSAHRSLYWFDETTGTPVDNKRHE
jgi:hypothetical protein